MQNSWKIFILILILMVLISGCAVSKDNSTPDTTGGHNTVKTDSCIEETDSEKASADEDIIYQTENGSASEEKSTGTENVLEPSNSLLSTAPEKQVDRVKLLVTRGFGRQVILQEPIGIEKNWTIMDVLISNLEVETRYGGGFIDSINGLKSSSGGLSGEMQDWFYYVNGICPNVGGLDYVLNPGEVIWWDYHPWKTGASNAAVIGSYPEPFLHGYRGIVKTTIIMCPSAYLEQGYMLEGTLKASGVNSIKVMELDEGLVKNRQGPTIVLGVWEELEQLTCLNDLNQSFNRSGTGVHFDELGLQLMDADGDVGRSISGSAGVIAATGSGLGDSCPLWLVSGTDLQGFEGALDVLLNNPGKISGLYNAAITAGEIIALPLP